MHEMALAEGVLQVVEEAARQEGALRVGLIVVEIGELSAVEPAALQFCFAAVARGSVAHNAVLRIINIPGSGWCAHCRVTQPMPQLYSACPQCGQHGLRPTGGTTMRVREIGIVDRSD